METSRPQIDINGVYQASEKVITREIEGDIIIVPIESGMVDIDDALYSLSDTGKIIWNLLGQQKNVSAVCSFLCDQYAAPRDEIQRDVLELLGELLRLKLIVKV